MKYSSRQAFQFILMIGIVSLFADMTYEGARSIFGPFFLTLGANGAIVGTVMGLGEFIGYGMRLVFGYLVDQTRRYWLLTIIGYSINLIAVPLLAFAEHWPTAALLIILERFGKAIRTPARDTILSYATVHVGRGLGFGIHESMDRIGALTGPLILSGILFWKHNFHLGFALLGIPAALALIALLIARRIYPTPDEMEPAKHQMQTQGLNRTYWLYLAAVGLIAGGYVDFAMISFHFSKIKLMPIAWIPFIYALTMAVDGLASVIVGRLYDIHGKKILLIATFLASFSAPLAFLGSFSSAIIGMMLWGIGLGTQQSVIRAFVANLVSPHYRGTAYGWLNLSFGLFWFVGSAIMGLLYDIAPIYLALFSVVTQLLAIPILLFIKNKL